MASWLSDAKEMRMPIEFLARCKVPDGGQQDMLRAYVIGWTEDKPKLFNVKVPHVDDEYYWHGASGSLHVMCVTNPVVNLDTLSHDRSYQFTDAEIIKYGLQDCEKVEVKQDEI